MSRPEDTPGAVFNIQHYSIHDGPGIRTTVFVCGCPLACPWCQNPECQRTPVPSEWQTTAGQVFEEVAADAMFYGESGGGVTVSGGEPLVPHDFTASLLDICRAAGIHTAVDTCGHAPWPVVEKVLRLTDLVLYDLKHMNSTAHERATGAPNQLILDNARRVHHELHVPMRVRIPIIPGVNDSGENLEATARFVAQELDPSIPVHLLPYHRLGAAKHMPADVTGPPAAGSKRAAPFDGLPPRDERMAELLAMFEAFGLSMTIGG